MNHKELIKQVMSLLGKQSAKSRLKGKSKKDISRIMGDLARKKAGKRAVDK